MRWLVLPLLAACTPEPADTGGTPSHTHEGDDTGTPPPAREVATDGGTWWVAYAPTPDPIPLNGNFDLLITVSMNDGTGTPDPTAAVVADASMPTHGHGMNVVPTTTANGDGTFAAEGFLFHMEGPWQIAVTVTGPSGSELAAFEVPCCD